MSPSPSRPIQRQSFAEDITIGTAAGEGEREVKGIASTSRDSTADAGADTGSSERSTVDAPGGLRSSQRNAAVEGHANKACAIVFTDSGGTPAGLATDGGK